MPKSLKFIVDARIHSIKKKMQKYQDRINERQAESKKKFPGQNVLEMETMEDWTEMAALAGELKGLKFVRAKL
jgi:hypothetical protein